MSSHSEGNAKIGDAHARYGRRAGTNASGRNNGVERRNNEDDNAAAMVVNPLQSPIPDLLVVT